MLTGDDTAAITRGRRYDGQLGFFSNGLMSGLVLRSGNWRHCIIIRWKLSRNRWILGIGARNGFRLVRRRRLPGKPSCQLWLTILPWSGLQTKSRLVIGSRDTFGICVGRVRFRHRRIRLFLRTLGQFVAPVALVFVGNGTVLMASLWARSLLRRCILTAQGTDDLLS